MKEFCIAVALLYWSGFQSGSPCLVSTPTILKRKETLRQEQRGTCKSLNSQCLEVDCGHSRREWHPNRPYVHVAPLLLLSSMNRRVQCFPAAPVVIHDHCSGRSCASSFSRTFHFAGCQKHLLMRDFENEISLAPNVESLMKVASSRLRRLQVWQYAICNNVWSSVVTKQ